MVALGEEAGYRKPLGLVASAADALAVSRQFEFVRGLTQSEFPKRGESRFLKEILHGPLCFFRCVDIPTLKPVQKRSGCCVDHHNFIGALLTNQSGTVSRTRMPVIWKI